jgi:coproporphyrinogen III oxidase
MNPDLKKEASTYFQNLQSEICSALEAVDGSSRFESDFWERVDTVSGEKGGGGHTRIIRNGSVFEQGGVNFSAVYGQLPDVMRKKLELGADVDPTFFATGVSLVIHPFSPCVPTVHANFRYFETSLCSWFGGGADLTPYVLEDEDAKHFHRVLRQACDSCSPEYYPKFKKECDEYFFLPHRKESRGIGGIFFDYLGKESPSKLSEYFDFVKSAGNSFIAAYLPIVETRKEEKWSDRQKKFQLLRRGRYVEFNLAYDRGTQFGLATGGRTESILMSIPPEVHWQYEGSIAVNEEEERLVSILQNPVDWV